MIPGSANPLLLATAASAAAYNIERSLRFNSSDSAYLSRTPASAGNRKTWTWAGWVKRSKLGTVQYLLMVELGFSDLTFISFDASDKINVYIDPPTAGPTTATTAAVYRDCSAWYHVVVACDTTQSTSSNRVKVYVNGTEQTLTGTYPNQNVDTYVNSTTAHSMGIRLFNNTGALDAYLAECYLIDGQALDPSSFGEFDTNGVWQPIAYAGSYGTNGFRLDFSDNSAATATTLGKDRAGSNNWTPNNFSVTAGAGNDSLVDSPTNYGTDSGAGGEVRGNYATLNPALPYTGVTLSNGNLEVSGSASYRTTVGSIGVFSGKWYWEVAIVGSIPDDFHVGIGTGNFSSYIGTWSAATSQGWSYTLQTGLKYHNGSGSAYGAPATAGDIIGVSFDADTGSLAFYKNGVSQGTAYTGLTSGPYFPTVSTGSGNGGTCNFGQRPFAYTAPSGFKALCTANLPTPVVAKPNEVMDVALWTGNGSARSITGLGFSPDFVWIKGRSGATDHALYDAVRGVQKDLVSNSTAAETTQTQGLTAFNSDGFSLGTLAKLNTNAATYAGWAWDAGSSTVTNTQGSITSQVRANASAGFSVVTYTGNGSVGATVGHSLGVAPALIINKGRNNGFYSWRVWHQNLSGGTSTTYSLLLNTTDAQFSGSTDGYITGITSTVFGFGGGTPAVNTSSNTYVAYCFAPVAGYSSFGSYTGNGSSDGPFVYTGFRPKFIIGKRSDAANGWFMFDSTRDGFNVADDYLAANASAAEATFTFADFLSNGFKLRATTSDWNGSGGTIVYAAFAESPFAYSRAR